MCKEQPCEASFAALQQHHGNAPISSAQVGIVFEFRHSFEELPTALVAFAPVLAIDAVANFTCLRQAAKSGLKCDAKIASCSMRTVAMNELEQLQSLALCRLDFRAQASARLFDTRKS